MTNTPVSPITASIECRTSGVECEAATRNDEISSFDVAKHRQRVFGMFHGESVGVTLLVRRSVMSAIVDRFGKDVEVLPAEDGWARVCVTVMAAPHVLQARDVRVERANRRAAVVAPGICGIPIGNPGELPVRVHAESVVEL